MMDNTENRPQTVVVVPANVTALVLGTAGIVVGIIALLGSWLSHLGYALIPVAIIGAILSIVGLVSACARGFQSLELPIIGMVISLAAISAVLIFQQQAREAFQRDAEARRSMMQNTAAMQVAVQGKMGEQRLAAEAASKATQRQAYQLELTRLTASLPADQLALENSRTNFSNIENLYNSYQLHKTYLTNAVYLQITTQISMWNYERNGYAQSVANHEQRELNQNPAYPSDADKSQTDYDPAAAAHAAFRTEMGLNYQANVNTVNNLDQQIAAAQQQLQNIADASDQWQAQRFNTAQAELAAAQNRVSADQNRIYYLKGVLTP